MFWLQTRSETILGKAFGIHRTIGQMGAIVGPIAAFAILQVMDIHYVFLFLLIRDKFNWQIDEIYFY